MKKTLLQKIKIKINKKQYVCNEGELIMSVAKQKKIEIPGLCGHPDFCTKANCRVCVVEIVGRDKLVTACSTPVEAGMEILTESKKVVKSRNINLELIFAAHIEKCADCVWRFECKLLKYAKDYKILLTTFDDRKGRRKTYKFGNAVELDGTQCIDCRNCLDACSKMQKIDYLEIQEKNIRQEVVPTRKRDHHCIMCGQCAVHCPVSAAQEQIEYKQVEEYIKDEKKIVVAQFAPSIRVSIGEDFGLPYGEVVTGQIVTGLRKLGFDYVFDVNFGADMTTIVEATELLERVKKLDKKNAKPLPMFTSCCPGWVNYVEMYEPTLIPNLTTSRSPHMHSGGAIKTYWAEKMRVDPKNIIVVSVMPCTAKKYEASRKEMAINGNFPVDNVITTREFSFMLKKNGIDLGKLEKGSADSPIGEYSGAAAIYGASGGVMESALRSAQYFACTNSKAKICETKINFKEVRGIEGFKEAFVDIAGSKLRVAVVNGIGNIKPVLEKIDKYDYIEVMACPGGCIGGGGQPIPTTNEIRKKRMQALYKLDKNKKTRKAHENKAVVKIMKWLKKNNKLEHLALHTTYKKK